MKRHISVFAFLLGVFAAVGPVAAWGETASMGALFISDKAVTVNVTGVGSGKLTTEKASGKSYYQAEWQWADNSFTVQVPAGYRFDAWYTLENDDEDSWGSGTSPELCTKGLGTGVTISGSTIAANAKTTAGYWGYYVVCPKFIKTYGISTAVSPDGAGTVAVKGGNGDGTVDAGGSVTLTATAAEGYRFTKWSDGSTNEKLEIKGVSADATYTAYFEANGYRVQKSEIDGTLDVDPSGTYVDDLAISWTPAAMTGYSLDFQYVKVLDGSKNVLANYTSGTSAKFNMKNVCGKFYNPVTIEVKYARTPLDYPWTIDVSSIGIASVRYKIGSGEYRETATNLTVTVPYGTQLEAYAIGEEFYTPEYDVDRKWTGKMPADLLTFKPTATLDGYRLTIDPAGGKFMGDTKPRTLVSLQYGTTNLNAIAAATDGPGVFLGYFTKSDPVGEKVYDGEGKNVACEYWTGKWPDGKFQGEEHLDLVARWGKAPLIAVRAEPESAGTVEGGGRILEGDSVTLTAAVTNMGYSFCCWTNLATVGEADYGFTTNANPWTFISAKDVEFAALFTGNVYKVTFMDPYGGQPPEPVSVTYGEQYGELPKSIYANPDLQFSQWLDSTTGNPIHSTNIVRISSMFFNIFVADKPTERPFQVTFFDPIGKKSARKEYQRNPPIQIGDPPQETAQWNHSKEGYWQDPNDKWDPPLTTLVTSNMTVNAKWTSIADVLDCTNLTFNVDSGTTNWVVCMDDHVAGNSCMKLVFSNGRDHLSTMIPGAGTLSFNWKVDKGDLYASTNLNKDVWTSSGKAQKWTKMEKEELVFHGQCNLMFYSQANGPVSCLIDNVIWTPEMDNPTYTVTYSWDHEKQTDTKKQGVPLTLKGVTFKRNGYEQDGWSKNPNGSVKNFELGGTYSDDADLTLYPTWKEVKPVVVDEIARALDCEESGLTFEATGGWSVVTNESFAQKGVSCLSNKTDDATLTTTFSQSGTLAFYWCAKGSSSVAQLQVLVDQTVVTNLIALARKSVEWQPVSMKMDHAQAVCFKSFKSGQYIALDHFTWTPDQTHPKPDPEEDFVTISSAAVSDGKFVLSFVPDNRFDYNLLTNANLLINSWGVMETKEGTGEKITFEPKIIEGQPQMFYKVETIQKN